jgi:5-methyltetrahydropteroyltriglutamate--homocysteine methyltransferase
VGRSGRVMHRDDVDIVFDDIGSYPLPKGLRLEGLSQDQYLGLVRDALAQKASAGVVVPTYPQFRDMIKMFMDPILDPDRSESPYLVSKEFAKIPELEVAEAMDLKNLRACITGPVELYLSAFGSTTYTDILFLLAESVARFAENALASGKVKVVSLDEPSLGISPSVAFSEDDILRALEIASKPCHDALCEVHLHSALYAEPCCRVEGINVVGIESAANPYYLKLVDRKVLEETDTYLRAGIARTDILSMAAKLNDRLGINLWDDPSRLEKEILGQESPEVITGRLTRAWEIFGERLKVAGPDCGLGSWPSQSMAQRLLSNCAIAIASFV